MSENDSVALKDIKYLPPEWNLSEGLIGKVSHFHDAVAYVKFVRKSNPGCHNNPFYPLHKSRLELLDQ